MPAIPEALASALAQLKVVAIILLVGLLIERMRPAERQQPWRDIGFNLGYIVFVVVANAVLLPPLFALMQPIARAYGPHLPIALPDGVGWQVLQMLAFFAIFDFFYYWFHRAQHVFAWFWPLHKLHHSERSVNITTTLRHHWLEEPIRVWVILLPMGLLFEQKPVTIAWIATTIMLWGYFVHTNLRLPLGPLTGVFAGPQWHRIHHSIEPEHADRNFAAFFPVYDKLFGTYVRPRPGEYPATGLHSREDLNGPLRAVFSPFRDWWRALRQGRSEPSRNGVTALRGDRASGATGGRRID